ncbi:zinc-binding dehydrogenase [Actinomadura madurae]
MRVAATAVGRLDLDVISGRVPTHVPGRTEIVPGHEVAGRVAAPGAGVDGWPLNRRVVVHPIVSSRSAEHVLGLDRDGGWAAYVAVPSSRLVPLPTSISFEHAAVLPSTVATPWSALTGPAGPRPGDSLGVWGIGGLGAHAVQLGRLIGAAPVVAVDPRAAARDLAIAAGADVVLEPGSETFGAELAAAAPGGVDVALEASGDPAAGAQALEVLGRNGRLILLAMTGMSLTIDDHTALGSRRRQVVGHFGSRVDDLANLVRLTALGRIDLSRSVASVYSLDESMNAVDTALRNWPTTGRLVLRPEAAPPRFPSA